MLELIKPLIIILTIGSATLHLQKTNSLCVVSPGDYRKWKLLWLLVTLIAFLSQNYWLFAIIIVCLLKVNVKGTPANQFTSFLWLLPLLPVLTKELPGFSGIRLLFELTYPRLLILTILFPLFLAHSNSKSSFFRLPGDKLLFLYLLVNMYISTRNGEITNILRLYFYLFTDIFLPYFVASRSLQNFHDFKKAALALYISISIIASIAFFESLKSWHLYATLSNSLDISHRFSAYLFREGLLRASGPFTSPIVLGYILTIGIGMGLAINSTFKNKKSLFFFFLIYIIALTFTLSRGPWVGTFILCGLFILLSREKSKLISRTFILATLCFPLLLFTTFGQKILHLLPFIGELGDGTVSYRQALFEKSWIVIQRNIFFGSNNYIQSPEMQSLVQGQGIIDVVNSYIRIALNSGLIGLGLFILFFLNLLLRLYIVQNKIPKDNLELHVFSISLFSTMISILMIIATVSSIDIINYMYWILAGIIAAFIQLIKNKSFDKPQIL